MYYLILFRFLQPPTAVRHVTYELALQGPEPTGDGLPRHRGLQVRRGGVQPRGGRRVARRPGQHREPDEHPRGVAAGRRRGGYCARERSKSGGELQAYICFSSFITDYTCL